MQDRSSYYDPYAADQNPNPRITMTIKSNFNYRERIAAISTSVFSYLKENTAWCVQMGCVALGAASAFTLTIIAIPIHQKTTKTSLPQAC